MKQLPDVVENEDWYLSMIKKGFKFTPSGIVRCEFHHITDCGRRLGHAFGLPLCIENHRGDRGFSGKDRDYWDKSLSNQLRYMGLVYAVLGKEPPVYQSKVVRRKYANNMVGNTRGQSRV